MGFAKFNICSPCCNYEFICHPYAVVNITDPRNNSSPTPTTSDLFSELTILGGTIPCRVITSMYPSGGRYEIPGLYPSSISPCNIPLYSLFSLDHTTGKFIESYNNGSIIDLNTLLRKITSDSRQRFDVPRDTGANAIQCGSVIGSGPIVTGCPCYEVSGNQSSAWGMISYQVYPHEFYRGCSSGQYLGGDVYTDCSQAFDFCSADICNGSGVDKHQAVNLPYCITKINAVFPYYTDGASIPLNKGVPGIVSLYDSDYGICNTGTPVYNQKTAILSPCFLATGNIYSLYYKPNLYRSGCGGLYLNAPYTTAAVFDWSSIQTSTPPPVNLCNNQIKYIVYDCQSLTINVCGETTFTPTIISEKEGYRVSNYVCDIPNNCPDCVGSFNKVTFAKKPLSAQVTYTLPNAAGYEFSGDLYLDNVPWESLIGVAAGAGVWIPNPATQSCSNIGYDLSFAAFVAATVTSLSYKGYQQSTYCARGFGCYLLPTCYQNEWNYALAYGYSIDMAFGSIHPVVKLTNPTRYYTTDSQNSEYECCDKTTGNPNGTLKIVAGDCDPLPSVDFAYRNASPGSMWNTKSCCELNVSWQYPFHSPLTFPEYCIAAGRPDCIDDTTPTIKSPESYLLVNDICNDVIDCSVYDADGNLIYTVTV